MKLSSVVKPKNPDFREYKFMIYGEPGAGKSTIASKFPDAIFIPTEPGLNFLECHTITDDEGKPMVVKSWEEFKTAVKLICSSQHNFKTVVIDTVDNAWDFCSAATLKERGIDHESDEAFGKGFAMVTTEFKKVINYLANSGFGLVFISHSKQGEREENGVKRSYIDNTLGSQGKKYINGLVDFIFYCYLDASGKRVMRTRANPNINAKDRLGILPEIMPMDFNQLVINLKGVKGDEIKKG